MNVMANRLKKLLKLVFNPKRLYYRIVIKRNSRKRSDESYLNVFYKFYKGKDLDFDNPVTFIEKLQWMKARDHDPKYTRLADKVAAKEYLKSLGGETMLFPYTGYMTPLQTSTLTPCQTNSF